MADALGWRKKLGVLVPSTNTIVEPEYYQMSVPGVTAHISRIHITTFDVTTDEGIQAFLTQLRSEMGAAVQRVMTAKPDYLVMGMSAETFWGGMEGNRQFKQNLKELSGLDVANGAEACERALKKFNAKRIGVVTPYQPIGDQNVVQFFTEMGFEVVAVKGLKCPTPASIAEVDEATLRQALQEVNSDKVDVLVQAGTNLSMVRLADEAERWLNKPVIAVNAATWWMALRDNGINDKLEGFGSLLRDF